MDDQSRFEINLSLISLKYPELKDKISKAASATLQFCETKKKEKNLKDSKGGYVYPQEGVWRETEAFWKSLDLSNTDILYVYGIGLGYIYAFAQPWLDQKKERYLVFIEDDMRMLARFMETERATELLMDDRVKIDYLGFGESEFEASMKTVETLVWYYNLLKYKITAIPYYQKAHAREYYVLCNVLSLAYSNTLLYLGEYLDLSRQVFKNMYLNYLSIEKSYLSKDFYGKFKGFPALICGAGSSFNKNISQLKNLGPRALLFAGGAAISFLNNHNISPHFGAAIDPNPPYKRFFLLSCFETPFLYQTRVSHQIISLVHGERLLVEDSGGHPLEDWLKTQLHLTSEHFARNYTVSDFCTQLACLFKCNPIIFIGMDLAFTDERYYAAGVSAADHKELQKESLIEAQDIFGKTVYTKNDWQLCAKKISSIAKDHPDITFINATEGGIGFEDIPNLPFAEVAQKSLGLDYDLEGHLHSAFENTHPIKVERKDVLNHLHEIKSSLQRCKTLCKQLNVKLAEAYNNWLGKSESEIDPEQNEFQAIEKKIKEEVAFKYLLTFFWDIIAKFSQRAMEAKEKGKDRKGEAIRKKMNEVGFYLFICEEHEKVLDDILKHHS
jgi:hypothetical protein